MHKALVWSQPCRKRLRHSSLIADATISRPPARALYTLHKYSPGTSRDGSVASFPTLVSNGASTSASNIRQQLRQWEVAQSLEGSEPLLRDLVGSPADRPNLLVRAQASSQDRDILQFNSLEGDDTVQNQDGDFAGQLLANESLLLPGSLIELRSPESRIPHLAVVIGHFNGLIYIYTNSGHLDARKSLLPLFNVSNFIPRSALKEIASFILGEGLAGAPIKLPPPPPPRKLGAGILAKMSMFVRDSSRFYDRYMDGLDNAFTRVCHPTNSTFLTLFEIARRVLPHVDDNKLPPSAMYAVHAALVSHSLHAFHPTSMRSGPGGYIYEICSGESVRSVQKVASQVRAYMDGLGQKSAGKGPGQRPSTKRLLAFIGKARTAIQASRKGRPWTQYGTLGPKIGDIVHDVGWSQEDKDFMRFFEVWVAYRRFPSGSRLNSIGSAILRFVEMYQSAELLTPTVGWTFMQEVGWIPPWEIQSRYRFPLPEANLVPGGGLSREMPGRLDDYLREDIARGSRKDWGSVKAYCVDEESSAIIDDGLSLEKTETEGVYWIHVHVADPASCLRPSTELTKYINTVPQNVYLPAYFESMFPMDDTTQGFLSRFSLAPGRPCLTFSTKVNEVGETLDINIEPGVLGEVVYMKPGELASLAPKHRGSCSGPASSFTVGAASEPAAIPSRPMTAWEDLSGPDREDLAILGRLGAAMQKVRDEKGGLPQWTDRQVKVCFGHGPTPGIDAGTRWHVDPCIQISVSEREVSSLVSSNMILAGETAAKWCAARHIPVPFRGQPDGVGHEVGIREALYAMRLAYENGQRPNPDELAGLAGMTGPVRLVTKPAPFYAMGVGMYTKATSPLRRFADLVLHWQIHGALSEERRRGSSLEGVRLPTASFLPFSGETLDSMLALTRLRETQISRVERFGLLHWMLQALVRAWQFGEATLPETFRFRVVELLPSLVLGDIDWFGFRAYLLPDGLSHITRMRHVCLGDEFEVKLHHVNLYTSRICVHALRRLDAALPEAERPAFGPL